MPWLAWLLLWPAVAQEAHEHGAPEAEAPDLLEESWMRTASGTAWQPMAAPMYAVMGEAHGADLMLHLNVFGVADVQGSKRGAAEIVSMNSVMGQVSRGVGRSRFGGRVMLSAEPLTMGGDGYPLLLQTGESWEGEPLVDRQHPHDVIMEVAGTFEHLLSDEVAVQVYLAPAGEPALGPVAFPHRASAVSDPVAPLSHHWQDSTHIAYGVVTAGLFSPRAKVEGSVFNGREPDENRYDLDLRGLDSFSGRMTFAPGEELVIQGSYAYLDSPEALEPENHVWRMTASASWSHPLAEDRTVDATLAWGRNVEGRELAVSLPTDAWLLEANAAVSARWMVFGRMEHVVKTAHDLDLVGLDEDRTFGFPSANLGALRFFGLGRGWDGGVGLLGNADFLPQSLEKTYGTAVPVGLFAFVQVRPAPMYMAVAPGR